MAAPQGPWRSLAAHLTVRLENGTEVSPGCEPPAGGTELSLDLPENRHSFHVRWCSEHRVASDQLGVVSPAGHWPTDDHSDSLERR